MLSLQRLHQDFLGPLLVDLGLRLSEQDADAGLKRSSVERESAVVVVGLPDVSREFPGGFEFP